MSFECFVRRSVRQKAPRIESRSDDINGSQKRFKLAANGFRIFLRKRLFSFLVNMQIKPSRRIKRKNIVQKVLELRIS